MTLTRHRLLIGTPLAILLIGALVTTYFVITFKDLRQRAAAVSVGMPRAEVEAILGKPILTLNRTGDRGHVLAWVDQFWQINVYTGRDGRVESVGCMPSNSAYNGAKKYLKRLLR